MNFWKRREPRGADEIDPDELVPAIRGARFPADRSELLEAARRNGAADELVEALRLLPERRYGDLVDVEDEFGRRRADRR